MLEIINAIILGIVQGLTEFLPISSSGHLLLVQRLLGFDKPGNSFEVMLHLGTLLAVVIYFNKDILQICGSYFTVKTETVYAQRRKTGLLLLTATIVTGVFYFFFKDLIDSLFAVDSNFNIYVVCIFLGVTGFMNIVSDKMGDLSSQSTHEMGFIKAMIIGMGQAFALNPGISRSGATITFGLLVGLKREQVATFSFLLSIPAILGAAVFKLDEMSTMSSFDLIVYLSGALSAFISGYLVISLLLKLLKQRKMKYFAYWCWAVALITAVSISI